MYEELLKGLSAFSHWLRGQELEGDLEEHFHLFERLMKDLCTFLERDLRWEADYIQRYTFFGHLLLIQQCGGCFGSLSDEFSEMDNAICVIVDEELQRLMRG